MQNNTQPMEEYTYGQRYSKILPSKLVSKQKDSNKP